MANPAEVQTLRFELEQARKSLEESVSRAELENLVQEATADAGGVITSLEGKIAELEKVKTLLHEQVQTTLAT